MAEIKFDITNAVEAMCKAFKADGYFVGKWIPCSERLPENDAKCLVYFDRRVAMARWYGDYDEHGAWYIISDDVPKLYRIKNVPYWMPLPEPPKEGADDGS